MLYSTPAATSSFVNSKRINLGTRVRRLALEQWRIVLLEMPAPFSGADIHLFCRTRGPRLTRCERLLRIKSIVEINIRTLYGALGSTRSAVPQL